MKQRAGVIVLMAMFAVSCQPAASPAQAALPPPLCTDRQPVGVRVQWEETQRNRLFEHPSIQYAADQQLEEWGLPLELQVDEQGRLVCYRQMDVFGRTLPLNPQRKQALAQMAQWRYRPFVRNGQPVTAIVKQIISEERLPAVHRDMPVAPLDTFRIRLSRGVCFGNCPSYVAEIRGDGQVTYFGGEFVDVAGKHSYRVPVDSVRALMEQVRRADFWSALPEYRAPITDNPTFELTVDIGGQSHTVTDYVGRAVGMPRAVTDLQLAVDELARTHQWITLSQAAVSQLEQSGFDFQSQAGADMLGRAASNPDNHDEAAMRRLIELGAPLGGADVRIWGREVKLSPADLLNEALRTRHGSLLQPLLARGVLLTNGQLDQAKLDRAFQAAIVGGRLDAVEAIWNVDATRKPALTYMEEPDPYDRKPRDPKQLPTSVLMLLSKTYGDDDWQGEAIVQWLVEHGSDLRARSIEGKTLLHVAANADDPALLRSLLRQGLDANTPGRFDLPALGSAESDEVALVLLQAGSEWQDDDGGKQFLARARELRWLGVLDWVASQQSKTTPTNQ